MARVYGRGKNDVQLVDFSWYCCPEHESLLYMCLVTRNVPRLRMLKRSLCLGAVSAKPCLQSHRAIPFLVLRVLLGAADSTALAERGSGPLSSPRMSRGEGAAPLHWASRGHGPGATAVRIVWLQNVWASTGGSCEKVRLRKNPERLCPRVF